jgi:hypothetical protein
MKKIIISIGLVLVLVTVLFISGIMPLSFTANHVTENKEYGGLKGVGELIEEKGFIMAHADMAMSQKITVAGTLYMDFWGWAAANAYQYRIYGKKTPWSSWEPLSLPGSTSQYITKLNPGTIPQSGFQLGGTKNLAPYSFHILGTGREYIAIRAEVWVSCKNSINPFESVKWRLFQRDEANLYPGWGSLTIPKDSEGRPRTAYEIGETVTINVETAYGGRTVGEADSWFVTLHEPADRGGREIKKQSYGDNVKSVFSFVVTEDMFSQNSNNAYKITLLNTILPKGELEVYTIDILAKAPSDVSFSGVSNKLKVGTPVTVTFSADVNSQTQLPISKFRISVAYGGHDTLLPSDPVSPNWIIPTTDINAVNNKATQTFTPTKQSYVTIRAVAIDTEGRASPYTRYYTFYAWQESEPPDETLPGTGEGDYGGGHTEPWWPWEPSGVWETARNNLLMFLIMGVIIALFAVIALFMPIPGGVIGKILVFILGLVIAFLVYIFM